MLKLYDVTEVKNKKKEVERYFPGFLVFVYCTAEQPIHTKTQKQVKKIIPLWQEKETNGKEPVCSKSKWTDNLKIQTQTDRKVGMKHEYRIQR